MVVWYSHLFKNFPQFVVIHTARSFSVVNEAEVYIFLELPWFLHDPMNVDNLISGSFLCFFETQLVYLEVLGSHTVGSLAWRILSMTLLT